jgi:GNAT superfamily N-acetyltransferase
VTEVREASAEDVPLILTLICELAEYERLSHEVVATEDALQEWLFGEKPAAEVLIAEQGAEAVGFALFFHSFSTFLGRPGIYLEDLYVRPAFRGRGVGKATLRHLAKLAKERGCGRLEWSVLDWNEPSIRFYESLGAVAMNDWTVHRVTGEALDRLAAGGPEKG